mmetsp:Transcript_53990/g.161586  ORF Transcript_53990/g.161586 Transcript_53990/m.161586 type:complete len:204 (-) Transcript_53990:775-1386(-)
MTPIRGEGTGRARRTGRRRCGGWWRRSDPPVATEASGAEAGRKRGGATPTRTRTPTRTTASRTTASIGRIRSPLPPPPIPSRTFCGPPSWRARSCPRWSSGIPDPAATAPPDPRRRSGGVRTSRRFPYPRPLRTVEAARWNRRSGGSSRRRRGGTTTTTTTAIHTLSPVVRSVCVTFCFGPRRNCAPRGTTSSCGPSRPTGTG